MIKDKSKEKVVLLVVGPTAVGKTGFAIRLARHYGTAVVSADSRQVYREMRIGTAVPTAEELALAPHYLIGHRSALDHYNVSIYEQEALEVLDNLFIRHDLVVVAGGSGMYSRVLEHSIDKLPDIDIGLRKSLVEKFSAQGLDWLQREVAAVDPEFFADVDQKNPARLLRALEVSRATGKKISTLRLAAGVQRPFRFVKIGLDRPREELHCRIADRVQQMLNEGLVDECRVLHPLRNNSALKSVGYSELFRWLDGRCTYAEAIEKITTNTRRYARRQMTWFRRDADIRWQHPDSFNECVDYVDAMVMEIRNQKPNAL